MATLYSKERSKYGNLTGQIIVWPVQINNDLKTLTAGADPRRDAYAIGR